MSRQDRLVGLITRLRDGQVWRGEDLARHFQVSARTIYRDIETMRASGIPIQGTPGTGYQALDLTPLPPLNLTPAELEALHLGMAIVGEASDPELRAAALSLAEKIDDGLPEQGVSDASAWKFATYPFADATRGFAHLATLRAVIRSKQKLDLRHREAEGTISSHVVRPLRITHWGRIWTLIAWSETLSDFKEFRLDLLETATARPELFSDEAGKTLHDFDRCRGQS